MARAARRAGGRDRRGGFALVEVMLALMLIAVLAALALPSLVRTTGPAALRIAAIEVSALLREDRNVAQSTARTVTTRVDPAAARILSGASTASVGLPAGSTARMSGAATQGIRFFADGRSSGGAILIASAAARYAVTVSRDTGAIRVGAP